MEETKKKSNKKLIIGIVIGVLIICAAIVGVILYQKAEKEKKIDALLMQIETSYRTLDLESVEAYIKELEGLGYSTSSMKEILEYDKSVKDDVIEFYTEVKDADKKLKNYSVSSMNSLVRNLNSLFNTFEDLPENEDSELGQYIIEVKNNYMFKTFKKEMNSSSGAVDFDYGLVKDGYIMVFETYTNEIVKIEFPYDLEVEE